MRFGSAWPPAPDLRLPEATARDLVRFGHAMLSSRDLDPAYPVLAELQRGMEPEVALWHSFLYVAFYDVVSGHTAFLAQPEPGSLPEWVRHLRTGIERRGLRGGKVREHVESYLRWVREYGGQRRFWMRFGNEGPAANWRYLQETAAWVWGNGRWAAYKLGDVLGYVNGLPLAAQNMGMLHSSGPKVGIVEVYELAPELAQANDEQSITWLELLGVRLRDELGGLGLAVSIDQVETLMCDFHSLRSGRYYVGHDIDLMLEPVLDAPAKVAHAVLMARKAALPPEYLGELYGWRGVQAGRKRVYRDAGRLLVRTRSGDGEAP